MPVKMSSLTREYIRVAVEATENGVAVDPTAGGVEWAFETTADAEPSSWTAGSWETDNGTYYARILIGTGGDIALADGKYWAWLKFTDTPEIPVRRVGVLTIT